MSRIKKYSEEYTQQMVTLFFDRFYSDPTPFAKKLKSAHLSKGSFSHLKNKKSVPTKHTLEILRAYLENRPPAFTLVREDEFYCSGCELVLPIEKSKDQWICILCANEINQRSKIKTRFYERYKLTRYAHIRIPGKQRDQFLQKRRAYYLNKNYGVLAKCIEMVQSIKKEIAYEKRSKK